MASINNNSMLLTGILGVCVTVIGGITLEAHNINSTTQNTVIQNEVRIGMASNQISKMSTTISMMAKDQYRIEGKINTMSNTLHRLNDALLRREKR